MRTEPWPHRSFAFVFLSLSACSEVPLEAPTPDFASVGGPPVQPIPWVDVCHVGEDGTVTPRSVPQAALSSHLGHGDVRYVVSIPAGATFSASKSITGNPAFSPDRLPALAFDGNPSLGWNAGTFPVQWIQADFVTPLVFRRLEARVDQTPTTGSTVHEVSLDDALVRTWSGTTTHGQVLSHDFGAPVGAQRIRITTTQGPSWVAWFEIRLLRC